MPLIPTCFFELEFLAWKFDVDLYSLMSKNLSTNWRNLQLNQHQIVCYLEMIGKRSSLFSTYDELSKMWEPFSGRLLATFFFKEKISLVIIGTDIEISHDTISFPFIWRCRPRIKLYGINEFLNIRFLNIK